ncbi:ATP-dependent Clp protease proteolytic subunit [Chloroflexi bacterium TSY]|nr:ATP-dependent Clp protease proteolytic subunit [Chloroflexi bacterium TSY]
MVTEESSRGERAYDIYSLLLRNRIIFVGTPIENQSANLIVAQMLYLDREDPEQQIQMYISSPGGDVAAGFGIYDTMQQMRAPIATIAVGATHSFGTILLTAGTPDHRYALENSTIHMHQPLIGGGGLSGQATDIHIHTQQLLRTRTRIEKIMSEHTGQSVDQLRNDMERDHYFDAIEAQEYGLVDHVLTKKGKAINAEGKE